VKPLSEIKRNAFHLCTLFDIFSTLIPPSQKFNRARSGEI